ncbi:MAG: tRNA(Ser) Um(44) 2'-O-methyltransferase [Stictis urceolatum]|nr:tRNA(Ser) Um(44) 2'-O-methyltransferase [Stictis urceolata]
MHFNPTDLTSKEDNASRLQVQKLPGSRWIPVSKQKCDFGPEIYSRVSLNLIQNPNITSSHLFRADILSDTKKESELIDTKGHDVQAPQDAAFPTLEIPGFTRRRVLVRKLIPRNPQLDRPVKQTCYLLGNGDANGEQNSLTILQPHCDRAEDLPWYHPSVRATAYWHTWKPNTDGMNDDHSEPEAEPKGTITFYYQLFQGQDSQLTPRLLRTAQNLLSAIYKHGQGHLAGYTKRVHHDQLISRQRVQDAYTDLKAKHAKRLCDSWVEKTEPTKHVFEDLSIAAFLIELWKDMYAPLNSKPSSSSLPPFPGFVDIGCGNGVLTEVLLLSGYKGAGYDARRRKTWSILSPKAQAHLQETLFVPQPLFDLSSASSSNAPKTLLSRAKTFLIPPSSPSSSLRPPSKPWHNGLFPQGTFIISNHADELTPWTPLLAYLMDSPFLAIPCCSHNLSGERFRAPSAYNSNTADAQAPAYFAANKSKTKAKSVAISIPYMEGDDDGSAAEPAFAPGNGLGDGRDKDKGYDTTADPPAASDGILEAELCGQAPKEPESAGPEKGDLKKLSPQARAKQPSAYASLCEWVTHLSREVGFEVEREMLRIPSTRNVGLAGRRWREGVKGLGAEERRERVLEIVRREGADGQAFVRRCEGVLAKSDGKEHG